MQATFAERYHDLEERHWWFVARREILLALLQRARVGPDADILEVGCSGGLMLALREAGYVNVRGIESASRLSPRPARVVSSASRPSMGPR